jgi:hypothetical protein
MNEWHLLETQLRSWTPRRPSAKLETQLFPRSPDAPRQRLCLLGWLAPATVCLLLLVAVFSHRTGERTRRASSTQFPIMAVTLSNVSFAAYLPGSFVNDQNRVRPGTFEWTNHGHSPSSIPSFPPSRTNYLKR